MSIKDLLPSILEPENQQDNHLASQEEDQSSESNVSVARPVSNVAPVQNDGTAFFDLIDMFLQYSY